MLDNAALYKALADIGSIDLKDLDAAYKDAKIEKRYLGLILLERDLISDQNLGLIAADYFKTPFINLESVPLTREVVSIFPEVMSRSKMILAFRIEENGVVDVAMVDPTDLLTLSLIRKRLKNNIKIFLATERDIRSAFYAYRADVNEVFKDLMGNKGVSEAPITKIVDTVLTYAYQSQASDIHIELVGEELMVRFRIDGVLRDVVKLPKELMEQILSRIKVMCGMRIDEHQAAQDGKFTFPIEKVEDVDVRVSVVPTTWGEKVVMRLLSQSARQFALADLGMNESDATKVREAFQKPYGMVLSTGPTGSGKTTTMYAILKILNKRDVNIMTIEDPVEYEVKGINQIQVNPKTNLTFASGLKSIVRQDPNIILVGEIRDEETGSIAINAAMTGHLVLSTLHTNDAATTFPRLLDMKVEPFLVASSINVVVAQRLVRRICSKCRVSYTPTLTELTKELPKELVKAHLMTEKVNFYHGKGCDLCGGTGYRGRVGIFEVMKIDDDIRKAINEKRDAATIKSIAVKNGMATMVDDGLEKVKVGLTTVDEVARVIKE